MDQQTKLELAYLADPKVFDRDSGTRRGEARKKLKVITGMDDAQLEGWKIMLDRNVGYVFPRGLRIDRLEY